MPHVQQRRPLFTAEDEVPRQAANAPDVELCDACHSFLFRPNLLDFNGLQAFEGGFCEKWKRSPKLYKSIMDLLPVLFVIVHFLHCP